MLRFREILVPIDFSDVSRRAVALAASLCARSSGRIRLLHVVEPLNLSPAFDGTSVLDLVRAEKIARDEVDAFLAGCDVPAGTPLSPEVHLGGAADTILREAEVGSADLIVIGTHGRRGLTKMLLGSVAADVLRRSLRPVLTVRGEGPDTFESGSIVCPTDFSACAREGASVALELAKELSSELHLVHVVAPEGLSGIVIDRGGESAAFDRFFEQVRTEAKGVLANELREVGRPGELRTSEHVVRGRPHREIVALADGLGAGMIVMGSQGRAGIKDLILGSTAERVVAAASCPVLTIRTGVGDAQTSDRLAAAGVNP